MSLQSFLPLPKLKPPKYNAPVNGLVNIPILSPSATTLLSPIVILLFSSLALVTLLSLILVVVTALSASVVGIVQPCAPLLAFLPVILPVNSIVRAL